MSFYNFIFNASPSLRFSDSSYVFVPLLIFALKNFGLTFIASKLNNNLSTWKTKTKNWITIVSSSSLRWVRSRCVDVIQSSKHYYLWRYTANVCLGSQLLAKWFSISRNCRLLYESEYCVRTMKFMPQRRMLTLNVHAYVMRRCAAQHSCVACSNLHFFYSPPRLILKTFDFTLKTGKAIYIYFHTRSGCGNISFSCYLL